MTHESKHDCQKRLAELAEAGAFGDLAELEAKLLLIGAAYQNGWQAARLSVMSEGIQRTTVRPATKVKGAGEMSPEDFREWLYQNGYHCRGDFHVRVDDGGVIDLAELLAHYVASHAPSGPVCAICGHVEQTDEHAGISHLPVSKAHAFVPSEAAAQPTPAYLSSDESTTVISSARAGDSPKGDRQAEIGRNDH